MQYVWMAQRVPKNVEHQMKAQNIEWLAVARCSLPTRCRYSNENYYSYHYSLTLFSRLPPNSFSSLWFWWSQTNFPKCYISPFYTIKTKTSSSRTFVHFTTICDFSFLIFSDSTSFTVFINLFFKKYFFSTQTIKIFGVFTKKQAKRRRLWPLCSP